MQRLEVSGAVRPIYGSLGVKRLITKIILRCAVSRTLKHKKVNKGNNYMLFVERSIIKDVEKEELIIITIIIIIM